MLPSLFISHGSPMLALQPGASGPALKRLAAELPRPKTIVVVSAHWESQELLVSGSAAPETWHDFGGFPRELFAVQYPAPGNPQLANQIVELLHADGLNARVDERRPFDHGTWVPLMHLLPQQLDKVRYVATINLFFLLTNAIKYGAASTPAGSISVSWRIEDEIVHLCWQEHGGPIVSEPDGLGFGSKLLSELSLVWRQTREGDSTLSYAEIVLGQEN